MPEAAAPTESAPPAAPEVATETPPPLEVQPEAPVTEPPVADSWEPPVEASQEEPVVQQQDEVATESPPPSEPMVEQHEESTPQKSDFESTMDHYLEATKDFVRRVMCRNQNRLSTPAPRSIFQVPDWLHHSLHAPVSQGVAFITGAVIALMVLVLLVCQCVSKASRERPLLAKLGKVEKEVFNLRNENALIKKEAEEYLKSGAGGGGGAGGADPAELALARAEIDGLKVRYRLRLT